MTTEFSAIFFEGSVGLWGELKLDRYISVLSYVPSPQAWLVERVSVFCHAPGSNPEECAHVLGCLGESGRGIVESGDFNQVSICPELQ